MSNDNIPFKDIENIKLLMRKRKKILSIFGENSPQFKKIENDFNEILNKYGLVHTEYIIGWLPKKPVK